MSRKKRATREEVIASTRLKLEKLLAQEAGTHQEDESTDSFGIKMIRRALRKRETLLHRAGVILNGKPRTAQTPGGKTIDEQIEAMEARLTDKRKTRTNAIEQEAKLPFDIDSLQTIVSNYDNAEDPTTVDVSFPELEVKVDGDPTDSEVEADAALEGEEGTGVLFAEDVETVTIGAEDAGEMPPAVFEQHPSDETLESAGSEGEDS